jgi:hypothetical protein
MKTKKIKLATLVALMVSFSVFSNDDPWTAPPPSFDDDTADNTEPPAPSPINEPIAYLFVAGILLAGYLTTKNKIIKSKNA